MGFGKYIPGLEAGNNLAAIIPGLSAGDGVNLAAPAAVLHIQDMHPTSLLSILSPGP